MNKKSKSQPLNINVEAGELTAQQKRLVKSVANMLAHVMTTDQEADYFDSSSELMKLVAGAIKQANFTSIWREDENIAYSTQALEFCLDNLNDEIYSDKIIRYDN